jgi:hypothetical protein
MRRFCCCLAFLFVTLVVAGTSQADQTWIIKVKTDDGEFAGKLMHFDAKHFYLLGGDGQLHEFPIALAAKSPRFAEPFEPLTHNQLKANLQREFGERYEITSTGHYMVVHPRGQRKVWGDLFEKLYRQMTHYFSTRRITVSDSEFPLIAIVFSTQAEFQSYMSRKNIDTGFSLAGFYAFKSNRIALFDVTEGEQQLDGNPNAETIVHEAAHQTAYNTGVHNRFTPPPQWLSEGIGTLFEAPGVYASSKHRSFEDRINREQLAAFRGQFPNGISAEQFIAIVKDDKVFRANPEASYAFSWAFTFMVAEKQTGRLSDYLKRTYNKPSFSNVGPDERLADFQASFGDDMRMVATRLNRFVRDLP